MNENFNFQVSRIKISPTQPYYSLLLLELLQLQAQKKLKYLLRPDKRAPSAESFPACQGPDVVSCQKVKFRYGFAKRLKPGDIFALIKQSPLKFKV